MSEAAAPAPAPAGFWSSWFGGSASAPADPSAKGDAGEMVSRMAELERDARERSAAYAREAAEKRAERRKADEARAAAFTPEVLLEMESERRRVAEAYRAEAERKKALAESKRRLAEEARRESHGAAAADAGGSGSARSETPAERAQRERGGSAAASSASSSRATSAASASSSAATSAPMGAGTSVPFSDGEKESLQKQWEQAFNQRKEQMARAHGQYARTGPRPSTGPRQSPAASAPPPTQPKPTQSPPPPRPKPAPYTSPQAPPTQRPVPTPAYTPATSRTDPWAEHERLWAEFERSSSAIAFRDVPWPPRTEGMLKSMAARDGGSVDACKKAHRRCAMRWHPDRWQQRYGARLVAADRERILNQVQAISQAANGEWAVVGGGA